jgi:hypothetical protein
LKPRFTVGAFASDGTKILTGKVRPMQVLIHEKSGSQMESYLPQRIKHTHLPRAKALLPMFDAVVNSIEAIEDRKPSDPKIDQ